VANSPGESNKEKLEMTIRNIRRLINADLAETHHHTALGRCLFRLGKFDEAIKAFKKALEGGAGGPFHRQWIYLRLGCIADLKKKRSDAIDYYKKATAITRNGSDFAMNKAKRFLERPYKGHKKDG
jgi:tetratricopeptide (TPR) repeat protein